MTIHILFNTIKKGLLLTAIQIRGTAETRRCDADAVRLQVITWNSPLTLCASYLTLPPPQLCPLFSELLLIATLVNPAHGIQGCPITISFDKNHRHFNFGLILFRSHFSLLLNTCTFFATPLAEKMHSFFLPVINPRTLFLLSSSSQFLPCLNKCANYLHRRIFETSLLILLGVSLVLWRRKADNTHSNPLFYGPCP